MGFINSLKGQLGRDTGRLISNKVYGNKHAIRHQSVSSGSKSSNVDESLDEQRKIFELAKDLKHKEYQQELLRAKDNKLGQELESIIYIKVPQKKDELIEILNKISMLITTYSWKDFLQEENRISNSFADAAFKKYEQCLYGLKSKYPKEIEILYFDEQFKKFKKQ